MFSILQESPAIHATPDRANNQYYFPLKDSSLIGEIELVRNPHKIDLAASRNVLVEGFISEYQQYLSPEEISDELTSWRDGDCSVRKYYENYFAVELKEFIDGNLHYWVQAKIEGNIVGRATFMREKIDQSAVYMNTLVVLPKYQQKGIGKQLVMSLISLQENESLSAIHLLLRKKNQGGRIFYSKLGFCLDPEYHREDNFVNVDLLEGLTWKNPVLEMEASPALSQHNY